VELVAEKMVAGGEALARHPDGRAVLLRGALPGERVIARETARKRHFLRADTAEVLEAAPARRRPPCPLVASGCGGCGWQHVAPGAQLELKVAVAQDALVRTGRIDDVALAAGDALPEHDYRTTLRLALDRAGQPGFRAARSHRVVTTEQCLVAHPALERLLPALRVPGARELVLRVGVRTGERLAHWTPDRATPRGLPDDVRTGPDAAVHELVHGARLRVSARAFFQSSPQAAELLVAAVRRAAGDPASWPEGAVIDAYGGVGLFAATAVPAERPVVVVEANAAACDDARINLAGRDGVGIEPVPVERWRPRPAALVIADPARAGLGAQAVAVLAATGAPGLVLVSCDPGAFARDARLLTEAGYRLVSGEVLDLFPNTHHLEVVSAFRRT
jgi:23S rRNA (uracil1939-C5)-methyltransferase